MTLKEILEAPKRVFFKRPRHVFWLWNDSLRVFQMHEHDLKSPEYSTYNFYIEDLIADDWIIKPEENVKNKDELKRTVFNAFAEIENIIYCELDLNGFNRKVKDQVSLAKELLLEAISKQPDYHNETKST